MIRRVSSVLLAGVLTALLALTARTADAQTSVTTLRGLDFGLLIGGVPKAIGPTSSSAMAFRISGAIGLGLGFSLMLPAQLARDGGGGNLPVTYCTTCGIYRVNVNSPTGGVVFNPNSGLMGLNLILLSEIYVWVGATANPTVNQPAGVYRGTVTLNVLAIL